MMTEPSIPAGARIGHIHLKVGDLDRQIGFYRDFLGFDLLMRFGDQAAFLSAGGYHHHIGMNTWESKAGDPPPPGTTGLYHFAINYPERRDLAAALKRLYDHGWQIDGASDHGTHEALYLPDPDGNGLELAADRPREAWPAGLGYDGGPAPLDLDALLETVPQEPPPDRVGEGLRVGHMHLHVGDIERGLAFYRDVVGFEEQANLGSAAFVSAGGYHHHLGFNVWNGHGVGPAPEHSTGLQRWTVRLPEDDLAAVRERAEAAGVETEDADGGFLVRDPWQTAVAFTP